MRAPRSRGSVAGWSSLAARRAHNPKVVGSNPTPATNFSPVLLRLEPRRLSEAVRLRHLIVLSLAMLAGCAYSQKVSLLEPGAKLTSPSGIVVLDMRDKATLKTNLNVNPPCAREYGDEFIAPTKIAYLKHLLGSGGGAEVQMQLKLTRFDTVEYCEASSARSTEVARAAATMSVTGRTQYYRLLPDAKGDVFIVRIAGEVNGKPFDVSRGFDYSNLSFVSFPSENPEYQSRVKGALREAADVILEVAGT